MTSDKEARQAKLDAYMRIAVGGTMLMGLWEAAPIILGGGLPSGMGWTLPVSGAVNRIPWFCIAGIGSLLPFVLESTKWIPKHVGIPPLKPYSWVVRIGKTYRGKWVYFDFGGVIPHCIVAGATKFGKTAFLQTVMYVLCHQQPPERLRILIIDLKGGASFAAWEHAPHVVRVERDLNGARNVLAEAEQEMWMRLDEIRDARLHFQPLPRLPRLFIVIDEGSLLKLDDECMQHLQNIAAIGREPHVHILYGTQRPSHEILPVVIRDQMEGRFVFNLNEPGSSRVVLGDDNTDAYRFTSRPGRMIHRSADGQVELQAAHVPEDTIQAWLHSYIQLPSSRYVAPVVEADFLDTTPSTHAFDGVQSTSGGISEWD
ncbi:MAG: hypothetical protein K6T83_21460 [Alicyclobacillus sp.]|nr:hypothetical protein [Alicyclobacillus sp.]